LTYGEVVPKSQSIIESHLFKEEKQMKKLLLILLILCFAAPAMAAEFYFYGSIRPHLGYYDVDEDFSGGPAIDPTISGPDDSGLLLSLSPQSRFGAKAVVSKNLSALVEFGIGETNIYEDDDERVYSRILKADWNFGSGTLTVGKYYTPATFLGYSSMIGDIADTGDAVLLRGGLPYIGRQPMVQLSFGDFEIALIEQNKGAPSYADAGFGDKDFDLPRIEAAYVFRTELANIRPVLGYGTYDVEGATAEESIDSFVAGIGVSLKLDPAYVKGTVSYLQNAGNYGASNLGTVGGALNAQFVGGDVEDSDALYGTLVAGTKLSPMLSVEAGLGYMDAEVDVAPGATQEEAAYVYYLQAPITLTKGFRVIPEIGMLDRDDIEVDGNTVAEMGSLTYLDFNFRVDF
jgi:hypothetical protein